jgi:hypothetical protein
VQGSVATLAATTSVRASTIITIELTASWRIVVICVSARKSITAISIEIAVVV